MSNSSLPVNSSESFIAENETMDLRELRDKTFAVAISTGDRNKGKFLSTTMRGPYSFVEMVEEVGVMWKDHQHHAKVVIMEKDREKPIRSLDENTTDYIECHYTDIVTEAMLDGVFDEQKDYTCRAGIVDAAAEDDPRDFGKKAEDKPKDDDEDDDL